MATKPAFALIDPRRLTIEAVAHMIRVLTGREPTAKELAEARAELEREQSAGRL